MAANCIRSLLLTPSPTAADHSIARYLFPRLITFVTDTNPEDPAGARAIVSRTLTQYVASVATTQRPEKEKKIAAGTGLLVAALLARARGEGEGSYADTKKDLLALAAAEQAVFRAVVAGLSGEQREFLGEVIRWGEGRAEEESGGGGAPAIQLKMDFGA